MIRRRYQFYGRVQGVGFRRTAKRAAIDLDVTGWVRNERDGSVTIEGQGSEAALGQMLAAIRNGRYINVERMEVKELIPIENDAAFHVKFK